MSTEPFDPLPCGLAGRLAHAIALGDDAPLREVDRLAGVGVSYAYQIVTGQKVQIGLQIACAYADVLGVSLDWLAGRKGAPEPTAEGVQAAIAEARLRKPRPAGRSGAGARVLAIAAGQGRGMR